MNRGIDYGLGQTNIDNDNGIRFGVITSHEVTQAWDDSSEADYGTPTCPECGGDVVCYDDEKHGEYEQDRQHSCCDYACDDCEIILGSDDVYGETPMAWTLDDGEYQARQGSDDSEIFILKSPYYTKCQFCSPCAPGAGYLLNECEDGPRAYCFGHDWFDGGKAPYTVYRVSDDSVVLP